jgi:hypothetical protein
MSKHTHKRNRGSKRNTKRSIRHKRNGKRSKRNMKRNHKKLSRKGGDGSLLGYMRRSFTGKPYLKDKIDLSVDEWVEIIFAKLNKPATITGEQLITTGTSIIKDKIKPVDAAAQTAPAVITSGGGEPGALSFFDRLAKSVASTATEKAKQAYSATSDAAGKAYERGKELGKAASVASKDAFGKAVERGKELGTQAYLAASDVGAKAYERGKELGTKAYSAASDTISKSSTPTHENFKDFLRSQNRIEEVLKQSIDYFVKTKNFTIDALTSAQCKEILQFAERVFEEYYNKPNKESAPVHVIVEQVIKDMTTSQSTTAADVVPTAGTDAPVAGAADDAPVAGTDAPVAADTAVAAADANPITATDAADINRIPSPLDNDTTTNGPNTVTAANTPVDTNASV